MTAGDNCNTAFAVAAALEKLWYPSPITLQSKCLLNLPLWIKRGVNRVHIKIDAKTRAIAKL